MSDFRVFPFSNVTEIMRPSLMWIIISCYICIPSSVLYNFAWRIDKVKVCTIIILKHPQNFLILFLPTKYCWGEVRSALALILRSLIWEDKILNWTAREEIGPNMGSNVDSNPINISPVLQYFTFLIYLVSLSISVSIVSFKRPLSFPSFSHSSKFVEQQLLNFKIIFKKQYI